MGRAIGIDIETELEAIEQGQCGGCRIGSTHWRTAACSNPQGLKAHVPFMTYCNTHKLMYNPTWMIECPDCRVPGPMECPICRNTMTWHHGHKYCKGGCGHMIYTEDLKP